MRYAIRAQTIGSRSNHTFITTPSGRRTDNWAVAVTIQQIFHAAELSLGGRCSL